MSYFIKNQYLSMKGVILPTSVLLYFLTSNWIEFFVFLSLIILTFIPRIILVKRFKANKVMNNFEKVYSIFPFLSGLIMSFLILFNFPQKFSEIAIVTVIVAGICSGAISSLGTSKYSYRAYIIPTLLSLSYSLYNLALSANEFYFGSFFVLLYCIILIKQSNTFYKFVDQNENLKDSLDKNFDQNFIASSISRITHEINTPLMTIMGSNFLLKKKENNKYNENIDNATVRISNLMKQISTLSKEEKINIKKLNLESILSNYDFDIDLKAKYFLGDFHLMTEIFYVLEKNATESGASNIKVCSYLKDSELIIEFSDNGSPILEENIKKIFNPFFSTKKVNKNLGIGLNVAKKNIESMNGSLNLKDNKTFILNFKCSQQ